MSDDKKLDNKIDSGGTITPDDILKSIATDNSLRSVNEGYTFKTFSKDSSKNTDQE